jgi:NADPH-dependent 2,4-dienoyl-CoA reductase/sulfur reductase-like enzyme
LLKEGVVPEARERKKVGVVGGGPAGIHAMMAACDRGHEVVLFEKEKELGGYMPEVCIQSFKGDHRNYFEWLKREVAKYPADIRLNTAATAELLEKERFDALIIAVGAVPVRPKLPGMDKPHVHWAPDAERGDAPVGEYVAVIGAGAIGIEAALNFAGQGKSVTVIEQVNRDQVFDSIAGGSSRGTARELLRAADEAGISMRFLSSLREVCDDCVACTDLTTGENFDVKADTVLYATGMRPRYEVVDSLRYCAPYGEVYIVGDARRIGNISSAVNQGFQSALHI